MLDIIFSEVDIFKTFLIGPYIFLFLFRIFFIRSIPASCITAITGKEWKIF